MPIIDVMVSDDYEAGGKRLVPWCFSLPYH